MNDEDSYPPPEADTSVDKSTSNTPPSQAQNPKRKRGLGIVTPHACTECRRKRAKCDGKTPCRRCEAQNNIECVYETRLRQSKAELRAEVRHLRRRQDATRHVMAALGQTEVSEHVMMRLWGGHSVQDVSRWLGEIRRDGVSGSPRPFLPAHSAPSPSPAPSLSPSSHDGINALAFRGRSSVLWPSGEPTTRAGTSWTRITSDPDLVEHLLALYFCWEYPTFASLSREHYLRDFRDGRKRYCSALLTNALLALASRLSNRPEVRVNLDDAIPAGEHFFRECQRLYDDETDHYCLTTVQALGIMAIREASCGHVAASEYYAGQCMRLALEMELGQVDSLDTEDVEDLEHRTVKLATFWGAFALDNALSFAGSLPRTSSMPSLPISLPTIDALEAHPWIPYTDDDTPLQLPYQQASNERSVFTLFCQLTGLSHESLYLIHGPSQQLTAQNLLHHYTKYLIWYDELPEALRLGQNFTPHVLFAHMYYHTAIVMLFWPVAEHTIIGTELSPKHICAEAGDAILALLKSYARLYTLGRTPSLTPYLALTAAVVHLAATTNFRYERYTTTEGGGNRHSILEAHGSVSSSSSRRNSAAFNALRADVSALEDMTQSHHLARKAISILGVLFQKWGIEIEMDTEEISLQDCIDICWPYNHTYQRGPPLGFSAEHLDREMEEKEWPEGRIRTTEKTVESVRHPLFVPLLEMRRRTRLTEEALGRAGFSHAGAAADEEA
ncbi:hypothetical protein E4U55_002420 [Claviceps digitariae]|nr:hypothetical protein E4U55_002420 [Claviceps digitariae]